MLAKLLALFGVRRAGASAARLFDRLPDAQRRQRHVDVVELTGDGVSVRSVSNEGSSAAVGSA